MTGGAEDSNRFTPMLISWCLLGYSPLGRMMPEIGPFLGVIVGCVLVDTMKKAVGGTTAYKNTNNKTDNQKLQILDKDG